MDEKKSSKLLKISIAILAFCLLGLGLYTIQSYRESKSHLGVLEQEKLDLKKELQELLSNYEQMTKTNEFLKNDLSEAKKKIQRLLDSVKKKEPTYVFMRQYKLQVSNLKKEKEDLFRTIDSLANENESLRNMVSSAKNKLEETSKRTDSLTIQNKKLTEKVSEASELSVLLLSSKGVTLKNNEETKPVSRARRVNKIEVCFTLAANKLTSAGEKQFFIQIINPKNNLLGERSTVSFGQEILNYSKIVTVPYNNERLDICTLVEAEKTDLIEGRYLINIFLGAKLLSKTTLELE